MKIAGEERAHFSVSQLTTYLQCPLKYYFQYELGLPWKHTPSAVAFGDTIHMSIKVMNDSLMQGAPIEQEELIGVFNREWSSNISDNNISWRTPDESGTLLLKGYELLELYYGKFRSFKPVGVELEFRLPLLDPTSGIFIESRDIVGKIDTVSEGGMIVEVKTASRTPPQLEVNTNLQLTLYSWAYRMLYGVPEKQIIVAAMVKTKEPKLRLLKTNRREKDYARLFHLIDRVITCIDQGIFYPNQMNVWGCRNCAYVMDCEKEWPL